MNFGCLSIDLNPSFCCLSLEWSANLHCGLFFSNFPRTLCRSPTHSDPPAHSFFGKQIECRIRCSGCPRTRLCAESSSSSLVELHPNVNSLSRSAAARLAQLGSLFDRAPDQAQLDSEGRWSGIKTSRNCSCIDTQRTQLKLDISR